MDALPVLFPGPGLLIMLCLPAAMGAHLGRYRGETRLHTESDLRVFLRWCARPAPRPAGGGAVDIERYVRRLHDVRHHQPSAVSRRLSVVVGFYRVCVIDQTFRSRRRTTCADRR